MDFIHVQDSMTDSCKRGNEHWCSIKARDFLLLAERLYKKYCIQCYQYHPNKIHTQTPVSTMCLRSRSTDHARRTTFVPFTKDSM
jgi:hypothetical protein